MTNRKSNKLLYIIIILVIALGICVSINIANNNKKSKNKSNPDIFNIDCNGENCNKEKIKLLNTFIGTKLSKGKHEVVIKYTPKVLYLSFIPSILGLCILILYLKKKKTTI